MALMNVLTISSTALTAQSKRLNVVASNLANADSAGKTPETTFHAQQVLFKALPLHDKTSIGVEVAKVVDDPSALKTVYEPQHPMADANGYVSYPNVNPIDEMVNMISASRSYQNEVEVMNTAKNLLQKTLTLGQ